MKGKCNRKGVYPHRILCLAGVAILLGCGGKDRPVREVQPEELGLRIERLDRDLFSTTESSGRVTVAELTTRYGSFFTLYVEEVLRVAAIDDPRLPVELARFVHDPDWRTTQAMVDSVLGDMKLQEREFNEAFGRLKVFFPDSLVPRIIAYNSGYNYGIFPTDSVLGIGVEWFVGEADPVLKYLPPELFPMYRKQRMRPEMLVPSAVKGWLMVHYTLDTRGEDLLTNLVEIGKLMVLLEAMLPGTDASLRFAFTPEQLKWCEDNEFNIWRELVANELLFSKDPKEVDRFMDDGPFTPGLPRESPGHIGEWIGYRMVNSYLRANKDITFAELFAMRDPQAILKTYKPR